jgi:hypothetical protein
LGVALPVWVYLIFEQQILAASWTSFIPGLRLGLFDVCGSCHSFRESRLLLELGHFVCPSKEPDEFLGTMQACAVMQTYDFISPMHCH